MSRSLKVSPQYIKPVKLAVRRKGFARQIDLAEDLQLSRSTIVSFLNGKPVDYLNFYEICQKLEQDLQEIAIWDSPDSDISSPDLDLKPEEVTADLSEGRAQHYPELGMAREKVIEATSPVQLEPMEAFKLQSLGLVQLSGNDVKPRCNLYAQDFFERLS